MRKTFILMFLVTIVFLGLNSYLWAKDSEKVYYSDYCIHYTYIDNRVWWSHELEQSVSRSFCGDDRDRFDLEQVRRERALDE
jgi:hypothetical protein